MCERALLVTCPGDVGQDHPAPHTHTPLPGDFGPVARRLTGHLLSAAGLTRCCGGLTDGEPRALALRAHGDVAERLQPRIGGKDAPER